MHHIMKTSLITLAFALVSSLVLAQTTTENYVKTTNYKVKTLDGIDLSGTTINLSADDKIESITYLDGLGRPKGSIAKQAGGNKENIVTPIVYDNLGRQIFEYLPVTTTYTGTNAFNFTGNTGLILSQENHYYAKYPEENWTSSSNVNAYSEKRFESSPLNRILEQGAPGDAWRLDPNSDTDHTIKFDYQLNTSVDEVNVFKVIFPTLNTENPQLYYQGEYTPGELYKSITKDENWQPGQIYPRAHTTEEYKNAQGQVILKRTVIKDTNHDTYYVYDDFGNLTYVLSPKGTGLVLVSERYKTFTDNIKYTSFVPLDKYGNPITGGSGNANVIIDATANTITVDFNMSFNSSIDLKNGAIFLLSKSMPDMILGTIDNGNYTVSIQDNFLYIVGSGSVSGVVENITASLPAYSISTAALEDLCYQYHYDTRNRLIEKKIPQKGWEYIVYDKLDRPVLTQDANLREGNDWLFTKYDTFDRVVYTGNHHFVPRANEDNSGRLELQDDLNTTSDLSESRRATVDDINGTLIYYSNKVIPKVAIDIYTINYYDDYSPTLSTAFPDPTSVFNVLTNSDTKSLETGSLVRVLETNDWITSVIYYDKKAQPIYMGSKNTYLNTTDIIKSELDFIGTLTKTESHHTRNSTTIIVTDRFTYDHANRLLTQKQQITGELETLIVKNEYDEFGQLKTKAIGVSETAPLQSVDYTYNVRGWLTQINDPAAIANDLFSFKINYNTTSLGLNNEALYNGNISETIWKTANDPSATIRGYAYEYDALNRITSGNMVIDTGAGYTQASGYHLNGLQYDKNGNIESLMRTGATNLFDNLIYTYNGNQLEQVSDLVTNQQTEGFIDGNTVGNDYVYDVNGNMTVDKNKDITAITYNHLNLPTHVEFENSSLKVIDYIYDATGVKLEKVVNDKGNITNTEYAGNYIYENSALKFFNYVYQYKDHLGNIRLSYADNDGDYQSLISSTFYEDYDGWLFAGGTANGSIELENESLKVNVKNQYNGTYIEVGDSFSSGDQITINIDVDKGNSDKIRMFLVEFDANNTNLGYYQVNYDVVSGNHSINHTIVAGSKLRLKIEKSNLSNDLGTDTYFYIDNVSAKTGTLEIIEENNYYPFGLKHKGYNNVVNGTQNNFKTYNGKEFDQSLNMNTFDLGARHMDPALGRFMVIDPMADFVNNQSPYAMADNNPIANVDEYGLGTGIGDFLRRIFGKGCSCKGKGSLGRRAKRRKKPKIKKMKRPTPSGLVRRPKVHDGPKLQEMGLVDLVGGDITIPKLIPDIPQPDIPQPDIPVPTGARIDFDKKINFERASDEFIDKDHTEKILSDLVKTLKEYPQIKVLILGNLSNNPRPDGATPEVKPGPNARNVMLIRARAVERFLIEKGINWRRLSVGVGEIRFQGEIGRTTKFILTNPK